MAEFALTNRGLQRSGGSGGLKADTLPTSGGGSRAAIQINPSAGRISVTPVQPPPTVDYTLDKSIQHFMGVAADAAFKYQEREATYFAKEANMQFNEEARKLFHGYEDDDGNFVPGMSSSKLGASGAAYSQYKGALEEKMQSMLEEMEPRVRQKALMQMEATRGTYMNKAANHRASEFQKAEEDQRYRAVQDLTRELTVDPYSYNTPDSVTGTTPKQKFYANFDTLEEADKAWYDTIQQIGEQKYMEIAGSIPLNATPEVQMQMLNKAAQAGVEYFDSVGKAELASSPKHMNAALGNIKRWNAESTRAFNSSWDIKIKRDKQEREIRHRETGQQAYSELFKYQNDPSTGSILTPDDISDKIKADEMSAAQGEAYLQDAGYKEVLQAADPQATRDWEDALAEAAASNWKGVDPRTGQEVDLRDQFNKDRRLDPTARARLRALQDNLQNPDWRDRHKRLMVFTKAWTQGKPWQKVLNAEQLDEMLAVANEEGRRMLSNGRSFEDTRDYLDENYNPFVVQMKLRNENNPYNYNILSVEDYNNAMNRYNADVASGNYTESEISEMAKQLDWYHQMLSMSGKRKAK